MPALLLLTTCKSAPRHKSLTCAEEAHVGA